MRAALTADQELLAETAARLAEELACPVASALPVRAEMPGQWPVLTDTGFACMHVAESHGGGGAHSSDVALVVQELARTLSPAPFVGQGVLAPELAWRSGAAATWCAALADGTRRVTVGFDPTLRTLGRVGEAVVAWDAAGATHALVLDAVGRVCAVALDDAPVLDAVDLTRVVRQVDAVAPVEVVGDALDAGARLRFEAFALAMLAADLVGVMDGAVSAASTYVASRVQFGVPVGTFQAVQHLAADAKVLLEGARSSMWFAAWAADELDPAEAMLAARQAKAYCSRVGREVVELQTQLFGGIAITWEERAHVRVRRALLDRALLGDEHVHEDAIADELVGVAG